VGTTYMAMLKLNISAVDKRTLERDLKYFVENAFLLTEN
jgi:hypothetical protein